MSLTTILYWWIVPGLIAVLIFSLASIYRKTNRLKKMLDRISNTHAQISATVQHLQEERIIHLRQIAILEENEVRLKMRMVDYKNSKEKILKEQQAQLRKKGK